MIDLYGFIMPDREARTEGKAANPGRWREGMDHTSMAWLSFGKYTLYRSGIVCLFYLWAIARKKLVMAQKETKVAGGVDFALWNVVFL
jgi:hypothetical protein